MSMQWSSSGRLRIAGKTLDTLCAGPPPDDASTLVLLHEGLGCTQLWRDFPQTLADATGWGVFAYSRAGYGQSDAVPLPRPLDYMSREAVDVLPAVLDQIGSQSAVLLGHSDGATIAAIHAGLVTDARIRGLILIAPHFFTEASGLAEIAKARDAFNHGDLRTRLGKYHRDPDNAFRGWNDSWLAPAFEAWNVAHVLDEINVPVLVIQGREDPYGTLAQVDVVTKRVRRAPACSLIIDHCRHAPHLEHKPAVVSAVAAFCEFVCGDRLAMQSIPLPAHAYIPGQTERHPEDFFEKLRRSAAADQTVDQLARCDAFQAGLQFLDSGFYWEAHEVLEPVWMALTQGSVERRFVQGLIQLANGCLKLRMSRPKAALRLVGLTRELLPVDRSMTLMLVEVGAVHDRVDQLEKTLNTQYSA